VEDPVSHQERLDTVSLVYGTGAASGRPSTWVPTTGGCAIPMAA
jgi:hypothetical protein